MLSKSCMPIGYFIIVLLSFCKFTIFCAEKQSFVTFCHIPHRLQQSFHFFLRHPLGVDVVARHSGEGAVVVLL